MVREMSELIFSFSLNKLNNNLKKKTNQEKKRTFIKDSSLKGKITWMMRQIVLRHPGASEINWLWSTDVTGGEMVSLYTILQNVFCCYIPNTFEIFLKNKMIWKHSLGEEFLEENTI